MSTLENGFVFRATRFNSAMYNTNPENVSVFRGNPGEFLMMPETLMERRKGDF
jgi:hypothetical protein